MGSLALLGWCVHIGSTLDTARITILVLFVSLVCVTVLTVTRQAVQQDKPLPVADILVAI